MALHSVGVYVFLSPFRLSHLLQAACQSSAALRIRRAIWILPVSTILDDAAGAAKVVLP